MLRPFINQAYSVSNKCIQLTLTLHLNALNIIVSIVHISLSTYMLTDTFYHAIAHLIILLFLSSPNCSPPEGILALVPGQWTTCGSYQNLASVFEEGGQWMGVKASCDFVIYSGGINGSDISCMFYYYYQKYF